MKKRFYLLGFVLFTLCNFLTFAQNREDFYSYKLENGLELYVAENDTAPLAYIEIAFKCGAFCQTKENCGLFHLYEHMMFKGNKKFPDADSVNQALTKMGVVDWNGSTGVDFVNYYFTVPSDMLFEGLDFWSNAIRSPLLENDELEREKEVVIAEIQGGYSNPGTITHKAVSRNLFPEMPWKLDSSGSLKTIRNATSQQLLEIQGQYYVPNNAAIFVGGAVNHQDVFEKVKQIYGDWEPSKNPIEKIQAQSMEPLSKPLYLVYQNPAMQSQYVNLTIVYRGPDAEYDGEDTYAADLWGELLANPSGSFKKSIMADFEMNVPSVNHCGAHYLTQKLSGTINFSFYMHNTGNPIELSKYVAEDFLKKQIDSMIDSKNYLSNKDFSLARKVFLGKMSQENENPANYLSLLRFWWASTGIEYFNSYSKNVIKSKRKDVAAFLKKYVYGKNPVILIAINSEIYKKYEDLFKKEGITLITQENAFWWNLD